MFSSASLRKSSPSIHQFVTLQRFKARPFFNQSQPSTSSSSSSLFSSSPSSSGGSGYDDNKSKGSVFRLFMIVGSGLGFCSYWFSSSSSSLNTNSFLSFSDWPRDTTWAVNHDDPFQHSKPGKEPKFLFGGTS
jgi:hypothetical protein